MSEDLDLLRLNVIQKRKFAAFKKAHKACLDSGIKFINVYENLYALNGDHLGEVTEGTADNEKTFNFDDIYAPYIHVPTPYVDCDVMVTIKKVKK